MSCFKIEHLNKGCYFMSFDFDLFVVTGDIAQDIESIYLSIRVSGR